MISDEDINDLLSNWYETKLQIANLEKKCDKYKKYSEKILDELGKNKYESKNFSIKRTNMSRSTISKKDVPSDIWNEYSNTSTYTAYYIVPKNKNKETKTKTKK